MSKTCQLADIRRVSLLGKYILCSRRKIGINDVIYREYTLYRFSQVDRAWQHHVRPSERVPLMLATESL